MSEQSTASRAKPFFRAVAKAKPPRAPHAKGGKHLLRGEENELRSLNDLRWVVLGDFNEVLSLNEVRGERARHNWQIANFKRVVEDCGLSDLGFTGYPFTYSNHRQGDVEVQARLDRVLADDDWRNCFYRATVAHVHLHISDHQMLILDTDNRCRMRRKKLFRFEAMWFDFDHPEYTKLMENFWSKRGAGLDNWSAKLKSCKEMLKSWNSSTFGDVRKRV
ncbi:hypothetical protein QQ045_007064 [Rhodiola kirilowii]